MNRNDLDAVIQRHAEWLRGEDGARADLSGADLSGAVLRGAVLSRADLRGAVLRDAVLSRAVLRDADLRGAVLSGADLRGAVLSRADLRGAVLSGVDLSGAVLSRADLSRAVLRGAVLSRADLRDARYDGETRWPAPTMLLLALWGRLSDETTYRAMLMDAAWHPEGRAPFIEWAIGGACPYGGDCAFQRVVNFDERREVWLDRYKPSDRPWGPMALVRTIMAEKMVLAQSESVHSST